jgi:hypothetical protein
LIFIVTGVAIILSCLVSVCKYNQFFSNFQIILEENMAFSFIFSNFAGQTSAVTMREESK